LPACKWLTNKRKTEQQRRRQEKGCRQNVKRGWGGRWLKARGIGSWKWNIDGEAHCPVFACLSMKTAQRWLRKKGRCQRYELCPFLPNEGSLYPPPLLCTLPLSPMAITLPVCPLQHVIKSVWQQQHNAAH